MESFNLFKCGESILNQLHGVLIKRKEHLFNKVDYRSSIRSDYYDNIVLQFPHQNLIKLNQDQTQGKSVCGQYYYSGLDMFIQMYRTKIIWSVMVVVRATGGCKVKQCNIIYAIKLQCRVCFSKICSLLANLIIIF